MSEKKKVARKYSCQVHRKPPSKYAHINPNKKFPLPKDGKTYKWHLVNFPAGKDRFKVILEFEKSMQKWQHEWDMTYPVGRFVGVESTNNIDEADLIFSFGTYEHRMNVPNFNHLCPFPFDGEGQVCAHAWSLVEGFPFGGVAHFDSSENWGDLGKDIRTVVDHEVGHIWDLDHSEVDAALMAPSYEGEKDLHEDDRQGFRKKMEPVKRQISGIEKNHNKNWLYICWVWFFTGKRIG